MRWCVFGGATGQRLSFFTPFYRLVGLQFDAYPDFPNSFLRNCPKRMRWVVIRYSSTYEKDISNRPLG